MCVHVYSRNTIIGFFFINGSNSINVTLIYRVHFTVGDWCELA